MENNSNTDNGPIPDTPALVDTSRVTITKGDINTDLWVGGTVNENPAYSFMAKVFDVGSKYGIDGGRISKLSITHQGEHVVMYDRDWVRKPDTREAKRALAAVKSAFREHEPQRAPEKTVEVKSGWRRALSLGRNKNDTGRER